MPGRTVWGACQRVVAACLAVWFAVVTADVPALHTCAMHGGHPAAMMQGPMMHTPMVHGAMVHSALTHDASTPDPQHTCSCLGQCCATTTPVAPAASDLVVVAAAVTPARTTGRPDHEYVAAWVDFVLPFSTAPPAATLG